MPDIEKILKRWRLNPVTFVKECFQWPEGQGPTFQQIEALEWVKDIAMARQKKAAGVKLTKAEEELNTKIGLAIKSGQGTGKDAILSLIFWWLLLCFPYPKGLVTGPTSAQLEDNLWREFRTWRNLSPLLMQEFDIQSDRIFHKKFKGEWFVSARTANVRGSEDEQAETLAGMHAPYMIMAVDEASAVPRGVFRPFEGGLTGEMNFAIIIGNPTRAKGYFFDAFNIDKRHWITLSWDAEDSPIVDKGNIDRIASKYGRDSNMFRIRVKGQFPMFDSDTLIPYDWVIDAVDKETEILPGTYKIKGLDVGAGGDPTVIVTRQGAKITDITSINSPDSNQVFNWVMKEVMEDKCDMLLYDPIGIGWYLESEFINRKIYIAQPVDVRKESPELACFRLRDALYWRLREQFENGRISIPNDEDLIGELTTIKYDTSDKTTGLIKIEAKRDMRKRGLESPNKADALALTYFYDELAIKGMETFRRKKEAEKKTNWRTV